MENIIIVAATVIWVLGVAFTLGINICPRKKGKYDHPLHLIEALLWPATWAVVLVILLVILVVKPVVMALGAVMNWFFSLGEKVGGHL